MRKYIFIFLFLISPAWAEIEIERIRVVAPYPGPNGQTHIYRWQWETISGATPVTTTPGPGGTVRAGTNCVSLTPSIVNLAIRNVGNNRKAGQGIFRWGDYVEFDLDVENINSPEVQVIEYGVQYTYKHDAYKEVTSQSPEFNLKTYHYTTEPLVRTIFNSDSSSNPPIPETGWNIHIKPFVVYKCLNDGKKYTSYGQPGSLSRTYLRQPYYEIDPKQDCPLDGLTHSVTYFQSNYKNHKQCDVSYTIGRGTVQNWKETDTSSNMFTASEKLTLVGMSETSFGVQFVESKVFEKSTQNTTTSSIVMGPNYEQWVGVEARKRILKLNVWQASEDFQSWERKFNNTYTDYYDIVFDVSRSCSNTTVTYSPLSLGQCVSE